MAKLAFTGGVGIADEWEWRRRFSRALARYSREHRWAGSRRRSGAFVDNWNEATGELPIHENVFPYRLRPVMWRFARFRASPTSATSDARRSMAALIAGSSLRLWITNAYFIPTPPFLKALCDAKARGVDVKILVPGPYHDEPAVRRASRRTWPALLVGNVELYEFQPTMIHGKIVLVDGAGRPSARSTSIPGRSPSTPSLESSRSTRKSRRSWRRRSWAICSLAAGDRG